MFSTEKHEETAISKNLTCYNTAQEQQVASRGVGDNNLKGQVEKYISAAEIMYMYVIEIGMNV